MKRKIAFIPALVLTLLAGFFTGCTNDEFQDVAITGVENLYIPTADKSIVLVASETASVYFEWEKAVAEDSGVLYYDVLFDTEDGDFSNPVYVVVADNRGINTGATITHKTLNRIAGLAGINSAETGVLKWTVRASRGLTKAVSNASRKILVTRLAGYEAPPMLFLTGAATEAGSDINSAIEFLSPASGEFLLYTRLNAGAEFTFTDSKNAEFATNYYGTAEGQLRLGEGAGTVAETGVYKIKLDFTAGTSSIEKIDLVEFFMCTPEQKVAMNYQGGGIWKAENVVPDFTTNWGDDRYLFHMTIQGVKYMLGSKNRDNQPPGSLSGEYFNIGYIGTTVSDRWEYSFKFPGDMRNAPAGTVVVDMILYMNTSVFTSEIVKKY